MTFNELMAENGYTCKTTFWMDFSIADRFGAAAVKDTFNRAFAEWKITLSISASWYWFLIIRFGKSMTPTAPLQRFTMTFGLRPMSLPALSLRMMRRRLDTTLRH